MSSQLASNCYASSLYLGLYKCGKWSLLENGFTLSTASSNLFEPLQRLSANDVGLCFNSYFEFASLDDKGNFRCYGPSQEEMEWLDKWCDNFLLNHKLFRGFKELLTSAFHGEPLLLELFRCTSTIWDPVFFEGSQFDMFGMSAKRRNHKVATHGLLTDLIIAAVSELGSSSTFPGDLSGIAKSLGIPSLEITSILLEHMCSMGAAVHVANDRWELTDAGAGRLFNEYTPILEFYARFSRWLHQTFTSKLSCVEVETGFRMFDFQRKDPRFHRLYGVLGTISKMATNTLVQQSLAVVQSKDCVRIVDIGGGQGDFLADLVAASGKPGTLFDLPETVARAQASARFAKSDHGVTFVGGNFFDPATYPTSTVEGSEGFTLWNFMRVLHDWSDVDQVRILKALRARITNMSDRLTIQEMLYVPGHALLSMYVLHTRISYGDANVCSLEAYCANAKEAGFQFISVESTSAYSTIMFGLIPLPPDGK